MPELNIDLLKRLCETPGIAGREDAVRTLVREEMTGLVDEIRTDALGNLIGVRSGNGGPRVMLAAHMDEIGFMVKHIDEHGFIRIHPVGGFDPSRLPAQRVIVHAHDGTTYTGSIGVAGKPIHLQAANEVKPPTIDDLFVDIGLNGETARAAIDIGDMITLGRSLVRSGPNIVSKALDDRVGLFIMLETLRAVGTTQAEIIAVATVQEEVGVRGATTSAWALQPDIGIALDITPAGDFSGAPQEHVGVSLGKGVAIKVMDPGAISDHALNQRLRQIAAEHDISYQLEILGRGGTDASAIQRSRSGVRATALSIPVRYAHTVNETCAVADVEAAIELLKQYITAG